MRRSNHIITHCIEDEMKYKIYNQDVRQWAKEYKGEKFHALFCDAPYHLSQSNAEELGRWSFKENIKTSRKKRSTGFMGMKWDGDDVAMNPETWRALAEHLYPGAFLFVYAGTMNDDLISYAMRQAGLEKFHSAKVWNFSSGFPKATRIDVAIDRAAGIEREKEKIEYTTNALYRSNGNNTRPWIEKAMAIGFHEKDSNKPISDLAKTWSGHRYGKQSLKPSLETVLIFIKPYEGRPIDSITKNGAGALNIDKARIGVGEQWWERDNAPQDEITKSMQANNNGRWPANFFLTHSISCVQLDKDDWQCIEQCPVRKLGEQSGELTSGSGDKHSKTQNGNIFNGINPINGLPSNGGDTGTASRFFHNASWQLEILEQIERADEVQYCAKVGRTERELGLRDGGVGALRDGGVGALRDGGRLETMVMNNHPTVKPIELNHHLASLLLPPKEYSPRRLLVPFSGVSSEMIGAILAGWDEVVGIESDTEHGYIKIADARLAWWVDKFEKCGGDYEKLKAWLPKYDEKKQAMKKQISLF